MSSDHLPVVTGGQSLGAQGDCLFGHGYGSGGCGQ